ncbi:hypothetical protein Q5P01_006781 [Channa striata]|uniref:Uncharacterized protein n=1 Tax=Channa striata TaxID=64152 RepID=A0AA88T4Q4_CHASR|nr:hypothetical protein Q5P01_006781 [Channa striata]
MTPPRLLHDCRQIGTLQEKGDGPSGRRVAGCVLTLPGPHQLAVSTTNVTLERGVRHAAFAPVSAHRQTPSSQGRRRRLRFL